MRSSLLIGSTVLATLIGTMVAADAPPADPGRFLSAKPVAEMRLNDLARSRARWAGSPYAKLAATGWGRLVAMRIDAAIAEQAKNGIDIAGALARLTKVAAGVDLVDGGDLPVGGRPQLTVALATAGDPLAVRGVVRLIAGVDPEQDKDGAWTWNGALGRFSQHGGLFAFRSSTIEDGAVEPVRPSAAARQPRYADACAEFFMEQDRLPELLEGVAGRFGVPMPRQPGVAKTGSVLNASLKLDSLGMRERWDVTYPPAEAAAMKALLARWPTAKSDLLASLPPTTLLALTLTSDARLVPDLLAMAKIDAQSEEVKQIDSALAMFGLPGYVDVVGGFHGDTLIYCEEGAPFPTITASIGCTAALGAKALEALKTRASMADNGDGTFSAFLGVVTLHAAWSDGKPDAAGGIASGELLITTNPLGVSAHRERQGGFTALPEIEAALGEVGPRPLAIGVSRSGASWGALAQLAAIPLSAAGIPQVMTLPQDLRAAGRHGFITYRAGDDGFIIDAAGLVGGPLGLYAAGGGGAAIGALLWFKGKAEGDAPAVEVENEDQVF